MNDCDSGSSKGTAKGLQNTVFSLSSVYPRAQEVVHVGLCVSVYVQPLCKRLCKLCASVCVSAPSVWARDGWCKLFVDFPNGSHNFLYLL